MELDDKTKLAIREEVEQRVEQRESLYWKFGGLVALIVVLFFAVLWKAQLSEVRTEIAKELAEQKVVEARDLILAIKSEAESASADTSNSLSLVKANEKAFLDRLVGLKAEDNVVLVDDLSKLFVSQPLIATNIQDGHFVLDYEPIPQTVTLVHAVSVTYGAGQEIRFSRLGRVEGKTIIFNRDGLAHLSGYALNSPLRIEYLRKSPR